MLTVNTSFYMNKNINLSPLISDVLASDDASHKNEIEDESQMIKAVQDSMLQLKIRQSLTNHRHKRETNVVCYGDLGCFEDSGPFGYDTGLPSSPEEIDTKFYVFSTKNRFVELRDSRNFFHLKN